ncbi:MAG: O-methyltransferase [Solirubrobacterales bacterium]
MQGWQFRPNKQIQRLMCVEVMRRLSAFRPLSDYRYVGLGGYEFVDFDLVYRALGIRRMTSIEDRGKFERYEFNRPFSEVDIEWGSTNERLPTLALDGPLIVWLDYCCPLNKNVLQDVRLLGEKLNAGSMLLVSVNADTVPDGERLANLEHRVTSERIPMDIADERHLDGWGTAAVHRRILLDELRAGLGRRGNGPRFEQLINIHYRDTSRMQTLGGVFVDAGTEACFRAAEFRNLPHVATGDKADLIRVPVLTAREVLALEQKMGGSKKAPALPWMAKRDMDEFAKLHRWYPRVPAPM